MPLIKKLNFSKIKALIIKEIIVLLKDPKARFALIIPPLIQLVLFSSVATLDVFNIKLAVVNRDSGTYSKEIIQDIAATKPYFINIDYLKNYDQVTQTIDKQEAIGAIIFAEDFSRNVEAGKSTEIQLLFDGRRLNSASIVSGYLQTIINNSITNKTEFKIKTNSRAIQGNVIVRSWFNPNLNYKWFIIPSLMGLILSTSIIGLSTLSIARERELGTFDQLVVSPLSPVEIILGKVFANMLIGIVQGIIIFCIIATIVPFSGNLFYMALGIFLYLIAMVCIGLFISSISANQQQATLISFFFLMPIILMSGFSTPFFNMPYGMQLLSECINPIHHFVAIVQMIFTKNVGFHLLAFHFTALALISLFTFIFTVWFFKRRVL